VVVTGVSTSGAAVVVGAVVVVVACVVGIVGAAVDVGGSGAGVVVVWATSGAAWDVTVTGGAALRAVESLELTVVHALKRRAKPAAATKDFVMYCTIHQAFGGSGPRLEDTGRTQGAAWRSTEAGLSRCVPHPIPNGVPKSIRTGNQMGAWVVR
jgi:hypothetical protein